jgi:hypothetical protein
MWGLHTPGVGRTDRIPVFLEHTKPLGSSERIEWSHQNHNYESVAFSRQLKLGCKVSFARKLHKYFRCFESYFVVDSYIVLLCF